MIFQSFSSKVYSYGSKVSTKDIEDMSTSYGIKGSTFQPNNFKTERDMSATFSEFVIYIQVMIYYIIS